MQVLLPNLVDSLGHHYITTFNVVVFSRFVQPIWKIRYLKFNTIIDLSFLILKERFYLILSSTRYKAGITKQTLCMLVVVKLKKQFFVL